MARMAPAAKRVPSVREEGFRVTMRTPSNRCRSQGSERVEILLSSLIREPITTRSTKKWNCFTSNVQRKLKNLQTLEGRVR